MATSPQEQRRRDLPWFRQISIPGLIYDALFRDYDTDERSNVHAHSHVWTYDFICTSEPVYEAEYSVLSPVGGEAAVQTL